MSANERRYLVIDFNEFMLADFHASYISGKSAIRENDPTLGAVSIKRRKKVPCIIIYMVLRKSNLDLVYFDQNLLNDQNFFVCLGNILPIATG